MPITIESVTEMTKTHTMVHPLVVAATPMAIKDIMIMQQSVLAVVNTVQSAKS